MLNGHGWLCQIWLAILDSQKWLCWIMRTYWVMIYTCTYIRHVYMISYLLFVPSVVPCQASMCQGGSSLRLTPTQSQGFIGGVVTSETGCGSMSCPWVLQPGAGQRFNLTFYNFLLLNDEQVENKQCHRYATILNRHTKVSSDLTVCGKSHPRITHMETSPSAPIEIRVFQSRLEGRGSAPAFLLRYQGESGFRSTAAAVSWPEVQTKGKATTEKKDRNSGNRELARRKNENIVLNWFGKDLWTKI